MKFTKEEISLCKQVAEKHRKDIEYGDWYWSKSHNKPLLAIDGGFKSNDQEWPQVFKIWTISDCLEFLEKKDINHIFGFMRFKNGNWRFTAEDNKYKKLWGEGKTRLEACLKAVLAVLEKEKK